MGSYNSQTGEIRSTIPYYLVVRSVLQCKVLILRTSTVKTSHGHQPYGPQSQCHRKCTAQIILRKVPAYTPNPPIDSRTCLYRSGALNHHHCTGLSLMCVSICKPSCFPYFCLFWLPPLLVTAAFLCPALLASGFVRLFLT